MNKLYFFAIAAVTIICGALIGWGILSTQWKTEAIKLSLEKGQNPLYVRCAYEDRTSDACKSMITSMALSGQFKDSTAPIQPPVSKK